MAARRRSWGPGRRGGQQAGACPRESGALWQGHMPNTQLPASLPPHPPNRYLPLHHPPTHRRADCATVLRRVAPPPLAGGLGIQPPPLLPPRAGKGTAVQGSLAGPGWGAPAGRGTEGEGSAPQQLCAQQRQTSAATSIVLPTSLATPRSRPRGCTPAPAACPRQAPASTPALRASAARSTPRRCGGPPHPPSPSATSSAGRGPGRQT